jgi:hypothetical protein
VVLQAGIGDPADIFALLQPLGQRQRILPVALCPQAQRLQAQEQLLRSKGVEGRAEIALDLDAGADDEGDGAKGVPKLEAVVALTGLDELGKAGAVLAPVELA